MKNMAKSSCLIDIFQYPTKNWQQITIEGTGCTLSSRILEIIIMIFPLTDLPFWTLTELTSRCAAYANPCKSPL